MSYLFMGVIVPCAVVIPLAVVIRKYNNITRACTYILYYLCFTALANITSQILASYNISNMPLLHTDTLLETILFLLFFKEIVPDKTVVMAINIMMMFFPAVCIINFSFLQSIYNFNTYTRPLEAIIFIALSTMYWLSENATENQNSSWADTSSNWIVSGMQLYFASTFFLFIFSNFLAEKYNKQVNIFIWNLHAAFVLVMYLLFAKGLSKCKR